jgi:hypothetical protein
MGTVHILKDYLGSKKIPAPKDRGEIEAVQLLEN